MQIGKQLAPARFVLFLAVLGGLVFAMTQFGWGDSWRDRLALAFDAATVLFLATLIPILRDDSTASIRRHAAENDANRVLVLLITSLLTLMVMAAVQGELAGATQHDLAAIAKLVVTLLLIWLFANVVYAFHYAHAYYTAKPGTGSDMAGLTFPGTKTPGYGEFIYFACTLGMTFQTSDVQITAPAIRHVVLFHSFAAFLFNIGVIAFTINALGGSA